MRVGGRLKEVNIPYERKHPLILAPGTIPKLIILEAHKKALHGGLKLTMNLIRENYWIINLSRHAKKCILGLVLIFGSNKTLRGAKLTNLIVTNVKDDGKFRVSIPKTKKNKYISSVMNLPTLSTNI